MDDAVRECELADRPAERPRICVIVEYYIPGFLGGGPQRSTANLVERLASRFDFWVLTRDHDLNTPAPYRDVTLGKWSTAGRATVFYANTRSLSLRRLAATLAEMQPHLIYLNGFFSSLTVKTLLLRRLRAIPAVPVIVVPRGDFAPGALRFKAAKKRVYLALAKHTGLLDRILWQATSASDADDIAAVVGSASEICVALNLPTPASSHRTFQSPPLKRPGEVRLVFLSRIAPKKNLEYILTLLPLVKGQVRLDIRGPLEDQEYWATCLALIEQMPSNVTVEHHGSVEHADVAEVLSRYHFFVLPTLGENFGHAIAEALAAGCPVVISDQTPWRQMADDQAGWDIPLDRSDRWLDALNACVSMNESTHQVLSAGARRCVAKRVDPSAIELDQAKVFTRALHGR